jgi:ubiquinone biosynthesis protein
MIRAVHDLNRMRNIATTVARHGFADMLMRTGIREVPKVAAAEGPRTAEGGSVPKTPKEHEPLVATARRFREMLAELGPTFVKLGQVLSSRPDLLPPVFVEELSHLQDNVPPFPFDEVREVVERGLGRRLHEAFSSFDETPVASASIAQVHVARTKSGDEVVVKVQRPKIAETIRADLSLLSYLAKLLELVIEESGIYRPSGIIEEFDRALQEEMDFLNEAANVKLFYELNKERAFVKVPRVYDDLTCRTVLTLERIQGVRLKDLDPEKHDRKAIATNIIEESFLQLFVDGVFHGDPHPGNLLILDGNVMGLLDFGLVGRLSKQMQETLILLSLAVALKDADTVARLVYRIGSGEHRVDLASFRNDVRAMMDRYLGLKLEEVQSTHLLDELLELALKHRLHVPKEYAIISRAAVTVEGIIRKLYPELDVVAVALPYAKRLLYSRIDAKGLSGTGLKLLLQAQTLLTEVPAQLSQILMDLEAGKFTVTTRSDETLKLVAAVRNLTLTIFLGLGAAGFTVGAFFILSRYTWEWRGMPIVALFGLLIASALAGAGFTAALLSGRLRKIRLRKWLKR